MINVQSILDQLDNMGIEYDYIGDRNCEVESFSSLTNYKPNTFTWIKKKDNIPKLFDPKNCGLAFVQYGEDVDFPNMIICKKSKLAFFSILDFASESNSESKSGIGHNTYVGSDVKIGENTYIGDNCSIDGKITIGDNTIIGNNVTIINSVTIGKNCVVQSGTVIGHDDLLSYTEDEDGNKKLIKHYGGVTIEDNVSIGANCVIARGTIDDTSIRDGTVIDALCHISHNARLGTNNALVSGTRIYGSVHTGNNVYIASGIVDSQCTLGDNCIVGINSSVMNNVGSGETVMGTPAKRLDEKHI